MGKLYNIADLHERAANKEAKEVAQKLSKRGYYSYFKALEVVEYYLGKGLTTDDIRRKYGI